MSFLSFFIVPSLRRQIGLIGCLVFVFGIIEISGPLGAEPPNFVWIISEDTAKHHLRHFDDGGAATPNITQSAGHGITFDRAFCNAPSRSVSMTTCLTGCYAIKWNTQFHRPLRKPSLPAPSPFLPEMLRQNGYYTTYQNTTGGAASDCNAVLSPEAWDQSGTDASWRNRPTPTTAFFHLQTLEAPSPSNSKSVDATPPQSTDPTSVLVPAFLPDSPAVRSAIATAHDDVKQIDQQFGDIIEQLRRDGLLENTFVFYFADHGGPLPRSSGYLYETGLHVPLVIRVPANFSNLVDRKLGSRTEGFVNFVDFAPTVLALAGMEAPRLYDGDAFLGPAVSRDTVDARDATIGYVDRVDHRCDLNRSLRSGNLKYIRHFEPIYPDSLGYIAQNDLAAFEQWQTAFETGEVDSAQAKFFESRQPESLFDLSLDPYETNNLADDDSYRNDLLRLRSTLMRELKELPDLSFMTELYLVEDAVVDPLDYGNRQSANISRYIDTVNLSLQRFEDVERLLVQSIDDADPLVRYWAIVAALSMGNDASDLLPQIQTKMLDVEPFVVAKAVEFVAAHGAGPPQGQLTSDDYVARRFDDVRPYLYRSLNRTLSPGEAIPLIRTAVYLAKTYPGEFPLEMKRAGLDMLRPNPDSLAATYWDYLGTLHRDPPPRR